MSSLHTAEPKTISTIKNTIFLNTFCVKLNCNDKSHNVNVLLQI